MQTPGASRTARIERASFFVCSVFAVGAVGLLVAFDVSVEPQSLAIALTLFGFLGGAYLVYGRARPEPVLSNLCGGLAVLACSGAMAGIISLVGLRYGAPLIDAHLADLDRNMGVHTPDIVRLLSGSPLVIQLLDLAYESSFPLLGCLMVFLAVTRRFTQMWTLAFVFAVTVVICTTISVPIPARGAFAHFAYTSDILDQLPPQAGIYHLVKFDYYRHHAEPIISFAHLQGVVTFPSFHCCLALMTVAACHGIRWLAPLSVGWNVLVIVSTLPVGGHYAIDLPVGAMVWLAAALAAQALTAGRVRHTSVTEISGHASQS